MKQFKDFVAESNSSESEDSTSYKVPTINLEFLKAQVEKLNKAAAKLGCKKITLDIGTPFMEKMEDAKIDAHGNETRAAKYQEFQHVVVYGEAPKLSGWSFVGKREPDENSDAVFTKALPGHEMPVEYSDDHPIKCDHCNKKARRNETFVVKNEHGKHMEVGRSCLKDFLWHSDPNKYANFAEALYDVHSAFAAAVNDADGAGRIAYSDGLEDVVPVALRIIKDSGFTPANGTYPTSMSMMNHFYPPKNDKGELRIYPTDEDKEEGKQIIEFMKNHPEKDNNDFWRNLSKMANAGAVSPKHFGYIAAGVAQYIKTQGLNKAKESIKAGIVQEPLGAIGDKVRFKGEVIGTHRYKRQSFSYYDDGVGYILNIKTDDGKLVKMFTAGGYGVEKGDRIEISGKVGSFDEEKFDTSPFKGMKMTIMAPRSRVLDSFNPKNEQEKVDSHYHVGDKVYFDNKVNGVTKKSLGIIVSKPTFGKFEIKSLKNDTTIHVSYDDLREKA